MKKTLTAILAITLSTTVMAQPETMRIGEGKSHLLCQVFTEGKYFCEDQAPAQGAASNTLILTYEEIKNMGGKSFAPVTEYKVASK